MVYSAGPKITSTHLLKEDIEALSHKGVKEPLLLYRERTKMSENRPFISVIAPIYGVEEYLSRAIGCILDQTYNDFELILVDDKSPDGCSAICEKVAAENGNVTVLHHEKNLGLSAARNTGLAAATGEYIWFFDPDDYVDTDFFKRIKEATEKTPAKVYLFGLTEEYSDANGNVQSTKTISPEDKFLSGKDAVRKEVLSLEKNTLYGYAWNKVYAADLLKDIRFKDITLIEDIDFNVRVFEDLDSLRILPIAPYHYNRRYSGSLSLKYLGDYFELNRKRIQLLYDQTERWGMCDETARGEIALLYTRYIYSAITRSFDNRSKMTAAKRREWLRSVFAEELFKDTVPYGNAKSIYMKIMVSALKKHKVRTSILIGRAIHIAKNLMPMLFSKLKHSK